MQNGRLQFTGFSASAALATVIAAGASAREKPGVGAAMAAPFSMLVGAVGLSVVWAAVPRATLGPIAPSLPPAAIAATPRQGDAVQQAALRQGQTLERLLVNLGSPVQLSRPANVTLTTTAAQAVADLRRAETDMVAAADRDAEMRLQSLRTTFRATGLDAHPYMATAPEKAALSPLQLRDAGLLAAELDVDPALARQVQRTARDLMQAEALSDAAAALPLATPVDNPVLSSPFGTRVDPFTRQASFHPGQDFSGQYGQLIRTTAPGVVAFAGQRTGYGNCVEVDHGYGFKTRYAHLSGFVVGVGTPVKTGDVIGRMGSTGRSTGVHLHYEVWANGRLMNPAAFLKAGQPTLRG